MIEAHRTRADAGRGSIFREREVERFVPYEQNHARRAQNIIDAGGLALQFMAFTAIFEVFQLGEI